MTDDKFTWKPGSIQWEGSPPEGSEGSKDAENDDDEEEDFGDQLTEDDTKPEPPAQKHVTGSVEKLETSAGDVKAAERLRHYWSHGEGAAKIGWGTPGDFDRCVAHVGKYMKNPEGYCNLRHHEALGYYPATHAAMDRGHKSEEPDLVKGYYPDARELLNMMVGLIEEAEG